LFFGFGFLGEGGEGEGGKGGKGEDNRRLPDRVVRERERASLCGGPRPKSSVASTTIVWIARHCEPRSREAQKGFLGWGCKSEARPGRAIAGGERDLEYYRRVIPGPESMFENELDERCAASTLFLEHVQI
jgi:hypothetical protein